ncbi:uncharacterized protein ASPGLDRAFT_46120 [Aspergillus glaucus CBS 516.65]|uniref:Uncharacterized protein n=1 Tax=Aspergillus glaucus CBS 516.65 TaxID=1160497 RepID=A0A1L9VMI8_ASPGL|nr:hypothetical protein ASPGLDRAFT_46120 [Aspergillus glaucus CBS 516.65]OJJ85148.1 hypothetical protein ASPGLDRAFT_46120 [Aspergillus glaucus CBS 516.65]
MNKDTRTWNFIIRRDKAVMIDFAICDFRRPFKDEEEWRCSKANRDEKGAVGCVMERYLNKDGFAYKRSEMYEKLDQDFMMETEDLKALTVS